MSLTNRARYLKDMVFTKPVICVERGLLLTESFQSTESQPNALRRAKALKHILENISIRIEDGELIVGWATSKARGGALTPEISIGWLADELETVSTRPWDPFEPLSEPEKSAIRKMASYWKGKSLDEQWVHYIPEGALKLNHIVITGAGENEVGSHPGHVAIDYDALCRNGLLKTRSLVEEKLSALDITDPHTVEVKPLYEGMIISIDAAIAFAARYSALAAQMATAEPDPNRKTELEEISRICAHVPAHPARTFREALQSSWFIFLVLMMEGWGAGMTFGRVDQYLYPYYVRDVEGGLLSKTQATELLTLLLIKMNGIVHPKSEKATLYFGGYPVLQSMTLGGVTREGNDAVNELSYLFLDAERDVAMTGEDFVIRVSSKNPEAFLIRACEIARDLHGKFKFISDSTRIRSMEYKGLPVEYARDYISAGCHVPTVPAVARDSGGTTFNFPLMLELALNNGQTRITGDKLGIDTGDPKQFANLKQVIDAFKAQFKHCMSMCFSYKNADLMLYSQVPCPFLSSFYPPCIEKGLDVYNGGVAPYVFHTSSLTGVADVGDSLAAIDRVIFRDKKATMTDLIDALDHNFEGYENLRTQLQKAPKFGNNIDEVDSITREILSFASDFISAHKSFAGIHNTPSAIAMTAGLPLGQMVGALPDGRLAGEPLAEGGISPHQGRNTSGVTSTLMSVAKMDQVKLTGGSILNVRIAANAVSSEDKLRKFASLIRVFCQSGGDLVQFNFVSNELLRDAQKYPERYKDLLVRVATYSAYFVELSPELQEDIIQRVEFGSL